MKFERQRYVAFSVSCFGELDKWKLATAIENAIRTMSGLEEISSLKYRIVSYNRETKLGILKVNHKFVKEAIKVLRSISKVDNMPVIIDTLRTSGTLRSIRRALPGLM